jgi:hypothetical protein
MKKLFSLTLVMVSLLLSFFAFADHHFVHISSIVKFDDTDCAIELTINSDDQDAFVAEDNVTLDGVEIATFADFIAGSINASNGNNDEDDKILITSESFDGAHDIDADITFDDSACADLDSDAVVAFLNVDSSVETTIDTLDLADVDTFDDNTAVFKDSSSDTPTLVDLTEDDFSIGNNSGDTATLDSSSSTGGVDATDAATAANISCSLSTSRNQPTGLWGLIVMMGLGGSILFIFKILWPPASTCQTTKMYR